MRRATGHDTPRLLIQNERIISALTKPWVGLQSHDPHIRDNDTSVWLSSQKGTARYWNGERLNAYGAVACRRSVFYYFGIKRMYFSYISTRGEEMGENQEDNRNSSVAESIILETKLLINQRLYDRGAITEEMYTKAKEIFVKEGA